jgi:hypothetical protein
MPVEVDAQATTITPRPGIAPMQLDRIFPSSSAGASLALFDAEIAPLVRSFVAQRRGGVVVCMGSTTAEVRVKAATNGAAVVGGGAGVKAVAIAAGKLEPEAGKSYLATDLCARD